VIDTDDGKIVWAIVRVRPGRRTSVMNASPMQAWPGEPLPNRPAGPSRPPRRPAQHPDPA
jgi:hypothetical protein